MSALIKSKLHILLPAFLALLLYLPTLKYEFVWDDGYFITGWQEVQRPISNMGSLWRGQAPMNEGLLYRPMRSMFYAASIYFFSDNPTPYHAMAIVGHAFISGLVGLVAYELTKSRKKSIIGGLIFAAHPIHLENIAWVTTFFDTFFIGLMLLGVYMQVRSQGRKTKFIALAVFSIAGLGYELALTGPIAIYLHALAERKSKKYLLIPLVVYGLGRFTLSSFIDHPVIIASLWQRGVFGIAVIGKYLQLIIAPAFLSINHTIGGITNFHFLDSGTSLSAIPNITAIIPHLIIGICVFTSAIWLYRKGHNIYALLVTWTIVSLLPVTNFLPLHTIFAEKYAYAASIPLSILIAMIISSTHPRRRYIYSSIYILILVVVLLVRMPFWRNTYTLWNTAQHESPPSAFIYENLGASAMLFGDERQSISAFSKSLSLAPISRTHQKLGYAYVLESDFQNAIAQYRKSLELYPKDVNTLTLLGDAYLKANNFESALEIYRKALTLDPTSDYLRTRIAQLQ